jgi:hypothetical protein
VQGKELKPGQYKLDLKDTTLVIANGKESVETTVKIETNAQKFSTTTIRYATADGKYSIQESGWVAPKPGSSSILNS